MEVLRLENVSKQYRLGQIGTGTLSHDLNRWWHTLRGKEDPYKKIGEINDRASKENAEYVWALKDIDFSVNQGDSIGIIGRNGAGKSTLLKILSQVTQPTTGSVKVKGRIASLLEVGTGFHPELTGRENIFLNGAILGMTKNEVKRKLEEIVEFAGIARYLDTPTKRYSSGMIVRLGFAVAAHLDPEILIIDEVLAVGDSDFQNRCINKMNAISNEGRTILFVSHNMSFLRRLCKRGILIEKGNQILDATINDVIDSYSNSIPSSTKFEKAFREGSGDVILNEIILLNSNGDSVSTLSSLESLTIECKLENTKNVDFSNVEIRFIFRNEDDLVVFLISSDSQNNGFIVPSKGGRKIKVVIPKFPISKGKVFIDVAIRINNIISDRIEKAQSIEVFESQFGKNMNYRTPKFFKGVLIESNWEIL